MNLRLPFSVDHQRKKTKVVVLPFEIYLMLVTSVEFEALLPDEQKMRLIKAKAAFERDNKFLSSVYHEDYLKHPYVRMLTGPDVQKFFCKLLSLNYQECKNLLQLEAGSFEEYFADLDLFWNEKFIEPGEGEAVDRMRVVLFCQACIKAQYQRRQDKDILRAKLDDFARREIEALESVVLQQKVQQNEMQQEIDRLATRVEELERDLLQEQERKLVLVPKDPFHMLGLEQGNDSAVEARAKVLMKALHPDRTGTNDTAYLFDMILRARDMITKD